MASVQTIRDDTASRFEQQLQARRDAAGRMLRPVGAEVKAALSSLNRALQTRSRAEILVLCLFLTVLIAYSEYLDRLRLSIVLFYTIPISIMAWFGGYRGGLTLTVATIPIWAFSIYMKGDFQDLTAFSLNRFVF